MCEFKSPQKFKDLEVLVEASVENKVADVHVETLQKKKDQEVQVNRMI